MLIAAVHLSTKATILHPTSQIVNISTTGNSKEMSIVINTDSYSQIKVIQSRLVDIKEYYFKENNIP